MGIQAHTRAIQYNGKTKNHPDWTTSPIAGQILQRHSLSTCCWCHAIAALSMPHPLRR